MLKNPTVIWRGFSGKRGARHGAVLVLVLAAFGAGAATISRRPPPAPFLPTGRAAAVPVPHRSAGAPPDLRSAFVSTRLFVYAHASCLVELGGGRIRAFWYAGTTEGTQDVTIQTAVYDPVAGTWSGEKSVASRETTQHALFRYVKKLGNPVAARAADGSLSLFYVTVSVGGWAGSSLTTMTSDDDGETWSRPRRLVTSPFLNVSTLVKAPAFAYADGTMGLPVHHEFLGKFGELLRLDRSGNVVDKVRLSSGRDCLQPVVLIADANRALTLLRYAGTARPRRVMRTTTENAGQDWTPVATAPLANSNAAVTGLVLPDGKLLLALNDSEDRRDALTLVISSDGGASWKTIHRVDDRSAAEFQSLDAAHYAAEVEALARATNAAVRDADGMVESVKRQMQSKHGYSFEFSYPSLIRTSRGDFHLTYSWNEAFIKHVQFSQDQLERWMQTPHDAHLP